MTVVANHSAYYVLSANPAETSYVTLPFSKKLNAFAEGRNLVVTVPPVPRLTGSARTSGAFGACSRAEVAASQTPTDDEFRQMHLLGVVLQNYAMAGQKGFISAIWTERQHGGSEIAISDIVIIRKLGPDVWSPGFYTSNLIERDHNDGFFGKAIRRSLQEAASYLCGALDVPQVDLSPALLKDVLPAFPSTRERKAALRKAAVRLRQNGFGNITKLRA